MGDTKWAIIASDDMRYGLSRMFIALTEGHQVDTQFFAMFSRLMTGSGLVVEMDEILARTPAIKRCWPAQVRPWSAMLLIMMPKGLLDSSAIAVSLFTVVTGRMFFMAKK